MPTKKTVLTSLSEWLFKRPVLFTIYFFFIMLCTTGIFAASRTWFGVGSFNQYSFILIVAFVISVYYFIIKKLPHSDMSKNDLIAISNGHSLITIIIPLFLLAFIGTDAALFQRKMVWLYLLHPTLFITLAILMILLMLYLSGVALSCVYAKYKRAQTIGISSWKIICSMPFTFLLMWMPGYLLPDTKTKTNLEIKSKWYSKFNDFVLANKYNTLFIFLLFLLLRNTYAGLPVLILSLALLLIYALWNLKHKQDLIKNINSVYALSAVLINVTIIIIMLIFTQG